MSQSRLDQIETIIPPDRDEDIGSAFISASQAVENARLEGKRQPLAIALIYQARVHFRMGQYQEAEDIAREALALSSPNTTIRAEALLRLGACAAETGSLDKAEEYYRQAADLGRQISYHLARFCALHNVSTAIYIPRGQFALALAADDEALSICHQHDLKEWLHFPLMTLTWASLITGQLNRAQAAINELKQVVPPKTFAHGYYFLLAALLAHETGNAGEVMDLFKQARSLAESTGEPWLNIALRTGLSRYYRSVGDGPAAREWADDAVSFASRVGYLYEKGRALVERGRATWICGSPDGARADFLAAIDLLDDLGAAFDLTLARLLLAAVEYQEPNRSTGVWREAVLGIIEGGYYFLIDQEQPLILPLIATTMNHHDPVLANASSRLIDQMQRLPPPPLKITTFGRFQVLQGDRRLDNRTFRSRRASDLFILLLLSPSNALSFDQIAESLWPGKDPSASRILFHHATSALRRVLEPDLPEKFPSRYLSVEDGWVELKVPPNSFIDFLVFRELCKRKKWKQACDLCRGEWLPEFQYCEWTIAQRQGLYQLCQRAMLEFAGEKLGEKNFQEALDICYEVLELEPWQEQAVFIGMQACIGLNDRARALYLYQKLEKTLRQDLDTLPHQDIQKLYQSIISSSR